ncbi:MAG: hypothetical protein REI09_09340 [Candidatus Dactylopiibacterium sp.]|nr:hypothetical protein [Candidatus Dactylopiibacterium sp.]
MPSTSPTSQPWLTPRMRASLAAALATLALAACGGSSSGGGDTEPASPSNPPEASTARTAPGIEVQPHNNYGGDSARYQKAIERYNQLGADIHAQ